MKRNAAVASLLSAFWFAACPQPGFELSAEAPLIAEGETVKLDQTRVPVVSECPAGQLLRRTETGWACGTVAFEELTSKPETFQPSVHNHGAGEITGLPVYGAGEGLTKTSNVFAVKFDDDGTATLASRSDHAHPENVFGAGAGLLRVDNVFSVTFDSDGTSNLASRSDHLHPENVYAVGAGLARSGNTFSVAFDTDGTSNLASRADHQHPENVYTAAGSGGLSLSGNAFSISAVSSTMITNGTLVDADVSASAAIAPSKISGTAATLSGNQNFDTGTLYLDATNNRVGIGTTSPAGKLDVAGDLVLRGGTSDLSFDTARTGYVSVPPAAFTPLYSYATPLQYDTSAGLDINEESSAGFVAPVYFPDGVTLSTFAVGYIDSIATDTLFCRLESDVIASGATTTHATTGTLGDATSATFVVYAASGTVDNANRSYHVYCYLNDGTTGSGGSDIILLGVRIAYTYTVLDH